jgi:D-alanyl-D-alanine carboxypeptidase
MRSNFVAAGAPGAIALVRDGDRVLRLRSGLGTLRPRTRIRVTDRFRAGSVTKTFVATVVLQLVQEHRLGLDDTVDQWLPGLVPNGQRIKLRQLLNMTSGLFDYLNDGDQTVIGPFVSGDFTHQWTPRTLVAIAAAHKPRFAPGTDWSYCNTCYVLLGMIIEKATGNTVAAELRHRIFAPLQLRSTSFDGGPRIAGRHASGYEQFGKPPLTDVSVLSPSFAWSAGAIVSTTGDIARFYGALLQAHLLKPQLLRAMETTVAGDGLRYGLGLAELSLPCGSAWGHDGGFPGYKTWALSSRDGTHQVVVFTNLGEDSHSKRVEAALARVVGTAYCG